MTRSFGLDALSALEALRNAMKKFRHDDLNEDLARDCAGKAWHLGDHVFKALGPNPPYAKLEALQNQVRVDCPELAYLQDICIESKHAEITRYTPRIVEARHHIGDFSRDDFSSEDFDTTRLEIELCGGETVSFNDVVDRALDYWSRFFDDHSIR